jgi:hypothetical protein
MDEVSRRDPRIRDARAPVVVPRDVLGSARRALAIRVKRKAAWVSPGTHPATESRYLI